MNTPFRTFVALCLLAFAARAADVVNNTANASTNQMQSTLGLLAQAFDTGAEATRLDSITVRLISGTGTSKASVQLWTSAGGSTVPETRVETLGDTGDFAVFSDASYTVNSPSKPLLAANTRYWVVVESISSAGSFAWRNSNSATFATDVGADLPSVRATQSGGGSWTPFGSGNRQIMSVAAIRLRVTNNAASGAGSLAAVLQQAFNFSGPDTITFDPALSGQTITPSAAFNIGQEVTIDATALAVAPTLSGGGVRQIVNADGTIVLKGLNFSGGSTNGGAAIYNNPGRTLTLERCTFTGNVSTGPGGAVWSNGNSLTVRDCAFFGNTGTIGGAIYANAGTFTATNCTFAGNTSTSTGGFGNGGGGAILINCPSATLTHCTVVGNDAGTRDGGGIYIPAPRTVTLANSIVAQNTSSGTGPDIANNWTLNLVGTNFIGDLSGSNQSASATLLTGDPGLAKLGAYGGPTQTMPPLAGSPAIDAAVGSSETTDQRGAARTGAIAGSAPDIGAVELAQIVVNTAADENNGIGTGGISLREAIALNTPLQAELIRFDPAVFTGATPTTNTLSLGGTVGGSAITVSNRLVCVDARDLPAGLTIDDGTATTYGLFRASGGATLAFSGLTLANGGGATFANFGPGGAIVVENGGTVALTRCTLSGNQAQLGGAIHNGGGGTATLMHCTLSGNTASSGGGAILNTSTLTLTHCTLTDNHADNLGSSGGAIEQAAGTLKLIHCLIAGNTASFAGPDIHFGGDDPVTPIGVNFIGDLAGSGLSASATLLTTAQNGPAKLDPAGLAAHGGPTKTIALLDGSPARDATTGSTATTDQRGFPLLGTADLGAYERQLGPIDDQTSVEDFGFSGISFSAGQVGTLSVSSDTPAVVPNGNNLQLGTDGPSRLVAVAPAPDANGSATITITDSLSGEKESFKVTFTAVNDAPVFTKGGDVNVFVDSAAQTLTGWATGISAGPADESGQQLTFNVSNDHNGLFAVQPAVAPDGTLTYTPAPGKHGVAKVTVSLSDNGSTLAPSVNTSAAQTFTIGVRLMNPESAKVVFAAAGTVGDAAPDAGVNGIPGGPAAGAKLTSLGVPCVDDLGNISYLAKWQSGPRDKSSGLFYRDATTGSTNCLLGLGGAAQPVPNATIKTLGDPVGSTGYVAALGTIKVGAKTSAAVFSNTVGGRAPQVVAQAGDDANAGGAKFKSFKAIEVAGGYLGVLAQLAPSATSTPKTTAANDTGLWIKDAGDPLTLVLREGQEVATGKVIKTLVAFLPGNGSPGHGRGWLREHTAPDGAVALALCLFTDKTQGIVAVDYATPNSPVLVTRSGLVGIGGPFVNGVANPAFASFGVPARDGLGDFAFLASLKPDATNGVTKANASGVFTGPTTGGYYGAVARVGDNAGATGGKFSQIKDVALGEDGTFAFPATIKGTAIKGPATATLWWQPAGKAFQLLAQGGTKAGVDVPADVQWKAFTSLAVPGGFRGPLFTATLIPNKTGVNATSANGVWAVDFNGAIRKLFRAGDPINVGTPGTPMLKTLKSFTLLKASVGSTGVTRSFNGNAQVVWLATFTDKTTAIVTTEVP